MEIQDLKNIGAQVRRDIIRQMIGVNNSFGESGIPAQLKEKYSLSAHNIVKAVKKVISKK